MEPYTISLEGVDDVSLNDLAKDSFTQDPHFDRKVVEIIRAYLLKSLHATPATLLPLVRAAHAILELFPSLNGAAMTTTQSQELLALWPLLLDVAMQIPHHHPAQIKLARLVGALASSPVTSGTLSWVIQPAFDRPFLPRGISCLIKSV